jgi:type VI secretion system protein ImpK
MENVLPPTSWLDTASDEPMPLKNNAALFSHDAFQPAYQDLLNIQSIVDTATEPTEEQTRRLKSIQSARNPLLEAAKPLLQTLSQMPHALEGNVQITSFRQLLEQELRAFQVLCDKSNIKHAYTITASYCLCTALDEAASSTPWGGSTAAGHIGVWSSKLLASSLHGDVDGGIKFFLLISRLLKNPQEHIHLLEVLYHLLGLGFQGQYSTVNNGAQRLQAIRQRVQTVMRSIKSPVMRALSPHWASSEKTTALALSRLPVWIVLSVLGLLLFGLFSYYQIDLYQRRQAIVTSIQAIDNSLPMPAAFVAPKPTLQLKLLLKKEIQQGLLAVIENSQQNRIVFHGDALFDTAQAHVHPAMLPLLQKVADAIVQIPGHIQIIGHSDNMPIRSTMFPNNQILSTARAHSVANLLMSQGIPAMRLSSIGLADRDPISSNNTRAGRAKNRRIEIILSLDNAYHAASTLPTQ